MSRTLFRGRKSSSIPKKGYHSHLLVLLVSSLMIGSLLLYNASSTYAYNNFGNEFYFLVNHLSWIFLSLSAFVFIQFMPSKWLSNLYLPLFFVSVFLLLFVLIPTPFSVKALGARRWILLNPDFLPRIPFLGQLSFQPSELFKLAAILSLPKILLSTKHWVSDRNRIIRYLVYLLVPVLLIFMEPDLKTSFIVLCIGLSILFTFGIEMKYFLYAAPAVGLLVLVLVLFSPYRMERVKTFLGKGSVQESSYHANQIKIALGSGGWVGVGLGQSRQKNEYLPEVVGDSIFAIYGEEFGFIGSLVLVALLSSISFYLFRISESINGVEQRLTAIALLTWYGVQTFLNLGAVSGVIPLTGVPLPLISYGGSSLVFILIGFAIIYKYYREGL